MPGPLVAYLQFDAVFCLPEIQIDATSLLRHALAGVGEEVVENPLHLADQPAFAGRLRVEIDANSWYSVSAIT